MLSQETNVWKMRSWENLACGIFLVVVTIVNGMPDYSGLPTGPYCARRYPGCCPDRQDDCNAPILGSLCYCDEFCDRFREEDCCPDYWSHCKGIDTNVTEPPPEPIKRSLINNKIRWFNAAKLRFVTIYYVYRMLPPGKILQRWPSIHDKLQHVVRIFNFFRIDI